MLTPEEVQTSGHRVLSLFFFGYPTQGGFLQLPGTVLAFLVYLNLPNFPTKGIIQELASFL